MNFKGARENSVAPGGRGQAGRQASSRHQSSLTMVGDCSGEERAVSVSKAVLVVATWRELLSRQAGRALSDGSCCGIVVSMERGGDREEAGWLGSVLVVAKQRKMLSLRCGGLHVESCGH